MSFRLVPKSVTLNDLERRNGRFLPYFSEFGYFPGVRRKSSRSLSHLLMSSCYIYACTYDASPVVYEVQSPSGRRQKPEWARVHGGAGKYLVTS